MANVMALQQGMSISIPTVHILLTLACHLIGWGDSSTDSVEDIKFQSRSFFSLVPLIILIVNLLYLTVNNDIHGLVKSVNDGSTSAFMWEWYVRLQISE